MRLQYLLQLGSKIKHWPDLPKIIEPHNILHQELQYSVPHKLLIITIVKVQFNFKP